MLCLLSIGKNVMNPKKVRTPAEIVHKTRSLLLFSKSSQNVSSQTTELNSLIRELKLNLYGDDYSEPSKEACVRLTEEFFKEDTFRLLVVFLPRLNWEDSTRSIQIDAFHVFKLFVANENKPPEIVTIRVTNRSKLLY